MGMKVVSEKVVGRETVEGTDVYVVKLVWDDGGLSFDVYRSADRECLTMDESFDSYPTDQQLRACVEGDE